MRRSHRNAITQPNEMQLHHEPCQALFSSYLVIFFFSLLGCKAMLEFILLVNPQFCLFCLFFLGERAR